MGKPYELRFHFAGDGDRVGDMRCSTCGKPIDGETQDWRSYRRDRGHDWSYIAHHRACSADDTPWQTLLRDAERREAEYQTMLAELNAFSEKWSRYDLVGELMRMNGRD